MNFLRWPVVCCLYVIKVIDKISGEIKRCNGVISAKLLEILLVSQRRRLEEADKLNIGCGDRPVEGWLNIGLFSWRQYPAGMVRKDDKGSLVLNVDINKVSMSYFGDIKYIYASHLIEHLTHEEATALLEKAYRAMAKGGVIRLACPDLELWVKKYYENDKDFFNTYRSIYLQDSPARTKGDIFMGQCHGFSHKWNYDFESLKDMMERAGFVRVSKKIQSSSSIPDIGLLEPSDPGRGLETLYAEGEK
ncbi:MAG: hypothetical protein WC515_07980 [Candidatus Omnitrophota bacterium]